MRRGASIVHPRDKSDGASVTCTIPSTATSRLPLSQLETAVALLASLTARLFALPPTLLPPPPPLGLGLHPPLPPHLSPRLLINNGSPRCPFLIHFEVFVSLPPPRSACFDRVYRLSNCRKSPILTWQRFFPFFLPSFLFPIFFIRVKPFHFLNTCKTKRKLEDNISV